MYHKNESETRNHANTSLPNSGQISIDTTLLKQSENLSFKAKSTFTL